VPAARWEGALHVPGRELTLVLDIAQDPAGTWTGSVILPGFGIKGAPIARLEVKQTELYATIDALLPAPNANATIKARLERSGALAGEFELAGNVARFELKRTGAAQVETPPQSTPIATELEGEWTGDYELLGYPRHVTLKLKNESTGKAHAELVIVGKKTNNVRVVTVIQRGAFVSLDAPEFGMRVEGKLDPADGVFKATLTQGPFEVNFALRRSP
jgi:hypothetical protein